MNALVSLHSRVFATLETRVAPALIPTLARFLFVASLFAYYINSGTTKLGEGLLGFWNLDMGAYIQILPRMFEAAGYDASQLGGFADVVVLFGTWAEFVLPVLLLLGLFTRIAALGMVGFVLVQTYVDVVGHSAALGSWFDRIADGLIDERGFWVFVLLVLVFRGGGPLSLDALLAKRHKRASFTAASQPR